MIKSHFEELCQKKARIEKRNLPIRTIARETGLSPGTIQRLNSGQIERVYGNTLDVLCCYFGVSSISELIEYVPSSSSLREKESERQGS